MLHCHVQYLTLLCFCSFSHLQQSRPLSCVSLLVSPCPFSSPAISTPSLFLIDETGSYPVRALALGGGMIREEVPSVKKTKAPATSTIYEEAMEDDSPPQTRYVPTSDKVNQRLLHIDFSQLTAEQGLMRLLTLLSGRADSSHSEKDEESSSSTPPLLDPDTRLELAVADFREQRLARRSVASLFKPSSAIVP